MDCREIEFSGHSLRRMFERSIAAEAVTSIVASGETITEYPEDTPYPSKLLLGSWRGRRLHVVVAFDEGSGKCVIVTVYEPDFRRWAEEFKTRRRP